MQDDTPILVGEVRERSGSRYSRRLREQGRLPAVVYGHKREPVSVSVDAHATRQMFGKGERVFRLQLEAAGTNGSSGGSVEGGEGYVLLKEVQYDYLGTEIVHCDFERVDLDERVPVMVSVQFVGEAKGLKKSGALMMHPTTELEIECQVVNLPDFIEVDVSDLDLGESIRAKDVTLPKPTMKLLTDPEAEVAHVVFHGGGDGGDEAASVEGGSEPEVVGEKKKDD